MMAIKVLCDYKRCNNEATKEILIGEKLISICEKHAEKLGFGSGLNG